ncbi:MAG: glycosyltransferase family 2 protein [Bacteroidales bacterium]|nr:glycosyltransferase family 2 protein [Bacteroidales bacterium]
MTTSPKYSIVIPVFNSEDSLEELFLGIKTLFEARNESYEVIFVEDHGKDGSWQVLKKLKDEYPDLIKAIRLSKNFGQHNATLCGFGFARGEFIITIDDDLQTPPAEIAKLIDAMANEPVDLVYGISGKKNHSRARNLGSASLKKSSKALHGSPGEGSSFRLITKDLVDKIREHHQHFIYLDEVLFWYTDDISFVEVIHLPRKYKQSGYSWGKLMHMMANILLYYTMLPLKFLVYGGFFFSLVTFGYGVFHIIKKWLFDVPLGYTSLIVAILFSTSIILFSLGVIGEYLRRIYEVQNRKPPFSIQKII